MRRKYPRNLHIAGDGERFDRFIEKVLSRPLPTNSMERVYTLAKELAEGAADGCWPPNFPKADIKDRKFGDIDRYELLAHLWFHNSDLRQYAAHIVDLVIYELQLDLEPFSERFASYIVRRWDKDCPNLQLLAANSFLTLNPEEGLVINKSAFDLVNSALDSTVFISYRRNDSSAFALLVLAKLKSVGLDAFLDMSLEPGEDWHRGLQQRIKQRDYFIVLLGKQTLTSEVVIEEVSWALESKATIIPIWHNRFKYQSRRWNLVPEIEKVVSKTHAIQVKEESALGYNNALVELLNRFGVTP